MARQQFPYARPSGVMSNDPKGPHVVDPNLVKSCMPAKRGEDLTLTAAQYKTKGALPLV